MARVGGRPGHDVLVQPAGRASTEREPRVRRGSAVATSGDRADPRVAGRLIGLPLVLRRPGASTADGSQRAGRGAGPWTISKPVVLARISTSVAVERAGPIVPSPARRFWIVSSGSQSGRAGSTYSREPCVVRRGVDAAQDGDQPEDRSGRPGLRARWRPGTGPGSCLVARQAGEQLRQPVGVEPLARIEHPARDGRRLDVVAVAAEPAGDHRVVVRPDGPGVVAERVVRDVVGRERPDPPARPHVVAPSGARRPAPRDRAARSRWPGNGRHWTRPIRSAASGRRARGSRSPPPPTRTRR